MISMKSFCLGAAALALLGLTACHLQPVRWDHAKYWQHASVSDAAHMEGSKSQQMLNRDIARCVTEIRELQRLGAIHGGTPGETLREGTIPDPFDPRGVRAGWETPERDGSLYAEHLEYHDFETCMMAKGWERVKNVPYDVAERARQTYTETVLEQHYRMNTGEYRKKPKIDQNFGKLNP